MDNKILEIFKNGEVAICCREYNEVVNLIHYCNSVGISKFRVGWEATVSRATRMWYYPFDGVACFRVVNNQLVCDGKDETIEKGIKVVNFTGEREYISYALDEYGMRISWEEDRIIREMKKNECERESERHRVTSYIYENSPWADECY